MRRGVLVELRPDGSVVAGLPEIPASTVPHAVWLTLKDQLADLTVDLRFLSREFECLDVYGRVLVRCPLAPLRPSRRPGRG